MGVNRILVYEFVTGGGCWATNSDSPPAGSLLTEGTAMLQAMTADLQRSGNTEVHVLADRRLSPFWPEGCSVHHVGSPSEERRILAATAAKADATLLIAPEFDGLLTGRCRWVQQAGGRLISPDADFVALAADKSRLAARLAASGIAVPQPISPSLAISQPDKVPLPAIIKPNCGAGSLDVRLLRGRRDLEAVPWHRPGWRLETFHPGLAASVAVICGPAQTLVLEPGRQLQPNDDTFRYLGGRWPLAHAQRQRAIALARRAMAALPQTNGFVGIDLVLGAAQDGSQDVVIEVNPRLTTSYVGLRQLATSNLATAMLDMVAGRPASVAWSERRLTFRIAETLGGAGACRG